MASLECRYHKFDPIRQVQVIMGNCISLLSIGDVWQRDDGLTF